VKKLRIVFLVFILLIAGVFLYLKFRKSKDFEPLIKAKLQALVKDASNGLYVLNIDKIDVDIVDSKIKVHNAELLIDSARLKVLNEQGIAPADVYKISLSDLDIDGLDITDLLNKKNIDLSVINLKNPTVEIYHPVNKNVQPQKDTSTLYSRIQKSLGHFQLKDLSITNMNFIYHNIQGKEKITNFKNISMKFDDIEIDSLTQFDTTRFLYAKHAAIYLPNYSFRTSDSLYFVKADSIILHAAQKTLNATGLAITPRYNKQEFSKKLTFYKDRYDIKFDSASFNNVDWYHLISGEGFSATSVLLVNGSMEVYVDRNIPLSSKSKVGNYPHQLIMKLDLPAQVDTINIKNFTFNYKELNPKTQKVGVVIFNNIDGTITNVTNIKERIAANKIMLVKAHGHLMEKADINATFAFDLTKTKNGDFSVDADLGPMDGTALNPATTVLGMFEINSLSIKKLSTHVSGNNNNANSTVFFVYDDLKITALKQDDSGKLKHRGFISFVANTFVINKSNTSKKTKGYFKRDVHRSFFYLIWKTILQGITSTVAS